MYIVMRPVTLPGNIQSEREAGAHAWGLQEEQVQVAGAGRVPGGGRGRGRYTKQARLLW